MYVLHALTAAIIVTILVVVHKEKEHATQAVDKIAAARGKDVAALAQFLH